MERLEPKVKLQHFDVGPFQSMGELSASIAVNFQNTFKSKVLWIEKLWKAIC